MKQKKIRFINIVRLIERTRPDTKNPEELIIASEVFADGKPVKSPNSLVRSDAHIELRHDRKLRGSAKLQFAVNQFRIDPSGLVALDLGASTGGFTRVLLERGVRRVYAVDVGHGQLLGSLRQDARVTNLERTNLGQLDRVRVPEVIDLITADLSYISLATAARQIGHVAFAPAARLADFIRRIAALPYVPSRSERGEAVSFPVNAYDHIKDMLMRIQTHPASRIDELMPWRWRPPRE